MNKFLINFCAMLCIAFTTEAQDNLSGHWEEHPKLHAVPAEFEKESSVVLEEHLTLKYEDGKEQVWMHRTLHRIVKVLDDKGIDDFKSMSLAIYPGQELQMIRARTIMTDGTVMEVSKDKMKQSKGEDDKITIVFALEGVAKNTEVEWIYSYRKQPFWYGAEAFQYGVPIVHSTFDISSPARLKFELKGYNGFPSARDTVIGNTRYLSASRTNTPALHDEQYSYYLVNRMKAEYKLSYQPEQKEGVRIFTWQELGQRLYSNIYESITDKEGKAVEKYLGSIGIAESMSEEDKIKKIESAIKTGIVVYKVNMDDDALKLNNVIASKSATEGSLVRLFAACFLKAGIRHELVLAANREDCVLDPDFENWNNVDRYAFYFPDRKKFISPTATYIRYPFTETEVADSKGLFCKLTTIGDVTKVIASIRTVTAVPVTESQHNINAEINFTPSMETDVKFVISFTGYCAMGVRAAIALLPKDKMNELVKNVIVVADKPEEIVKCTVTGEGFENYSDGKPLVFDAVVKTNRLIEKAGPKYLFRIGDVIGKQSELYQAVERRQPVDMDYPHTLNRTIVVNLPEGYRMLNPEALEMKAECKDAKGTATAFFTSTYKLEGSKLTVNISEVYSQVHVALADFESFRKVINASADFNKVILLLEKI